MRGSTTSTEKLRVLLKEGIEPFLINLNPHVSGPALQDFFRSEYLLLNFPPGRRRPDVEGFLRRAIDSIIDHFDGVRSVVFASSTSVYAHGSVAEEDVTTPLTASGRALVRAEKRLQSCYEFRTTVLRFGGLYGYTRKPGRFLRVIANGSAPVNLVHRDDAVAVTLRVLQLPVRDAVYNVVADRHPAREEFYRKAAQWLGKEPPEVAYDNSRPGKTVINSRLKQELNYSFLHPNPMVKAP